MARNLISIEDAIDIVRQHVGPHETEPVALSLALGRRLAVSIFTDVAQPPFDRSMMDGYAVRSADVARVPTTLAVIGQLVRANNAPRIGAGQAVQINTGAPMPDGADAVVRFEETALVDGGGVRVESSVPPGKFITRAASYCPAGATALTAGTRLGPLEIAIAASAGVSELAVYRQPTVALLSTGSELVDVSCRPVGGQIRNSNAPMLEALACSVRCKPVRLGSVGDDRGAIAAAIEGGTACDVICITGGISMGAFDYVPEVLETLGARLHIRKIAIKPGRPTIFATLPSGTLVFALPGNPISAYVGFQLLVRGALERLQGGDPPMMRLLPARLRGEAPPPGKRRSFRPVRASVDDDGLWHARTLRWQGSGDVFGMATANALLTLPPGAVGAGDGDTVDIVLTDDDAFG